MVEKALLHQIAGRYQIHELLRQFALEQLQQHPDQLAATQTRHSHYYLALLQTMAELKQLDIEFENVRTSWRTAVTAADFAPIQKAADAFYRYYARRALYQEGQHDFMILIERLANQPTCATWQALLCTAQRCLGAFCYHVGDYTAATTYLQQALQCAQMTHAQGEQMWSLAFLGLLAGWQGREAESDELFAQSLAISHTVGNEQLTIELLLKIAQLRGQEGRYAEARQLGEESLAISRSVGQAYWSIRALDVLGFTTYRLGQLEQSKHYYGEGLRLAQQTNDLEGFVLTSGGLGLAASKANAEEILAVVPYVEQGLHLSRQMGQPFYIMGRLAILGALYKWLDDSEKSLLYSQEGVVLARKLGNPFFTVINLHYVGIAARRLKRFEFSRTCLLESIVVALQMHMGSAICDGLYELAQLYLDNLALPLPVGATLNEPKAEVLAWLYLAVQHPACDAATAAKAQVLIDRLTSELPTGQVTTASLRDQNSIEAAVTALLGEAAPIN